MVSIEAAAAGVPVVASLSGGLPEGLRPDTEALYFPIGDPQACATAIASVLANTGETAARVQRARARAAEFSFDRYLDQMAGFIDAAVAPASDRSAVA